MTGYTNHTILAEALEKWPLEFLEEVVRDLVDIIKELDALIRAEIKDPAVQIIDESGRVHMAHMDIHFSNSVNGVVALHTEILKNSELKAFYELYPEKFNNKTNGITFRRWLEFANQDLADYIKELIGDEYLTDATKLENCLPLLMTRKFMPSWLKSSSTISWLSNVTLKTIKVSSWMKILLLIHKSNVSTSTNANK